MERLKAWIGSRLARTLRWTIATQLVGVISGVLLARVLGPTLRGEFAAVVLWASIAALFADCGLGLALSYLAGTDAGRVRAYWGVALGSAVILGGGASTLLTVGLALYRAPVAKQMFGLIFAMAAVPLILANGFQAYLLLGRGFVSEHNRVRFSTVVSYVILVVAAAATAYKSVVAFAIAYLFSHIVTFIVGYAFLLRRCEGPPTFDRAVVRPLYAIGMKNQVASLAAQANLRLDQTLMSLLLPFSELGYYVLAVSVSQLVMPVFTATAINILPDVFESRDDERSKAYRVLRSAALSLGLGLPAVVLGIASAPYVIPFIFGNAFRPAVPLSQVLFVAVVFQGLNAMFANGLRALALPSVPAAAEVVGAAGTAALLMILMRRYGAMGAAVTSLMAYALVTLIECTAVFRNTALKVNDPTSTPR